MTKKITAFIKRRSMATVMEAIDKKPAAYFIGTYEHLVPLSHLVNFVPG